VGQFEHAGKSSLVGMYEFRKFVQVGVGIILIALGLYAVDHDQKAVLVLYVIAGAFGMAALVEKLWK
jgi:hypothetical protein